MQLLFNWSGDTIAMYEQLILDKNFVRRKIRPDDFSDDQTRWIWHADSEFDGPRARRCPTPLKT